MKKRILQPLVMTLLLALGMIKPVVAESLSPATYRTLEQVQTAMTDGDWSGADRVLQ
jgi:hypothetical protein